jgi:uncharacterized protein YbjT (DUF2867 family)
MALALRDWEPVRSEEAESPNDDRRGVEMASTHENLIAAIGATGQQGGAVVRALEAGGQFKARALTRSPGQHRGLADAVVEADLNRPETLPAAFRGAQGVFLVTKYWEPGTDEVKQSTAAIRAAKDAGVKHIQSNGSLRTGHASSRGTAGP